MTSANYKNYDSSEDSATYHRAINEHYRAQDAQAAESLSTVTRVAQVLFASLVCGFIAVASAHFGGGFPWGSVNTIGTGVGTALAGGMIAYFILQKMDKYSKEYETKYADVEEYESERSDVDNRSDEVNTSDAEDYFAPDNSFASQNVRETYSSRYGHSQEAVNVASPSKTLGVYHKDQLYLWGKRVITQEGRAIN